MSTAEDSFLEGKRSPLNPSSYQSQVWTNDPAHVSSITYDTVTQGQELYLLPQWFTSADIKQFYNPRKAKLKDTIPKTE